MVSRQNKKTTSELIIIQVGRIRKLLWMQMTQENSSFKQLQTKTREQKTGPKTKQTTTTTTHPTLQTPWNNPPKESASTPPPLLPHPTKKSTSP